MASKKKKTINNNKSIEQETQQSGESSQSHIFNNDELTEVLVRLPTKTLFQSKSVCKTWLKLISSQPFKSTLKSFPPRLTGFFYNDLKFYTFATEIDHIGTQVDFTLSFLNNNISIIDAHNGLILCGKKLDRFEYVVTNPLTKQWLSLPNPSHKHYRTKVRLFCYDNGFIVISLLSCHGGVLKMEMYSSETNAWKEVEVLNSVFKQIPNPSFHDSCIYLWDVFGGHLCVYNLIDEGSRVIKLPILPKPYPATALLGVSADSVYYAVSDAACFSVWVLVDGFEWVLKHRFSYVSLGHEFPEGLTSKFPLFGVAFHPVNSNLMVLRLSRCEKVLLFYMDQRRIEVVDNIKLSTSNQVIPYWLPACPPCVRST